MRTHASVVLAPRFCHGSYLVERQESTISRLLEVRSASLSTRIVRGLPRSELTRCKPLPTSSPVSHWPTSMTTFSRPWFLTGISSRNRRPPTNLSAMTCMLPLSLVCPFGGRAARTWVLYPHRGFRPRIPRHSSRHSLERAPHPRLPSVHPTGRQVSKSNTMLGDVEPGERTLRSVEGRLSDPPFANHPGYGFS